MWTNVLYLRNFMIILHLQKRSYLSRATRVRADRDGFDQSQVAVCVVDEQSDIVFSFFREGRRHDHRLDVHFAIQVASRIAFWTIDLRIHVVHEL